MKPISLTIVALLLSACGQSTPPPPTEEDLVKASVASSMKDPASAKFSKVSVIGKYACSTVNGKNAFGGYTGDQIAYSIKSESGWLTFDINDKVDHAACVQVMTSQNSKEKN